MQETWEYIEAYFEQALSPEEKKAFEARCEEDAAFAGEVAFYLTTRSTLREALVEEKQRTFGANETVSEEKVAAIPVGKIMLRKWLPYAAAACILLFVAAYFLLRTPAPEQLAGRYIKENYTTLSQTMDASRDSLQLGIAAYNNKDYQRALTLFEGVRQNNPASSDAKKYAGLTYLQTNNYNKALECFIALSAMQGQYSNRGDFLQAVTLLQRDHPGDKEEAKKLLQKVVDENEEGSRQAKEWLKNW